MSQMSARTIRDDLGKHGITTLMDAAARGIHTLPDSIADDYAKLQEVLDENSDRFGNLQGWQAEKAAADLMQKIYSAVAFGLADRVIIDHLRPALVRYLDEFRANVQAAGKHAVSIDIGALLSQPDDVRQAHIRLLDSYQDYHALRASWEICRKRNAAGINGATCIDPDDIRSPLAEVRNLPDLVADWQLAFHGRKPWPWSGSAHHVRLVWLLNNGADVWMPTGQEQDQNWQKYNPGRRAIAA
ncbi:hypothetical protein [Streptomyces sp. RLB3-6]|uniref:hypothetical protein n=1 Tax=Streptomyces sp. RLB3-6 TaxID=2594457 RepID=UPI001164E909|nr:hypothetical protein [Streptomyces sp. RLB3-6]QDN87402.1 hypothetical protein FNV61_18755 [Streptomyces sp. RLB3-6]